jgi:hypothetical protein
MPVRVALLVLSAAFILPLRAVAGPVVDPSTLQPPPPPGATCRADGVQTICHTQLTLTPVNEPVFDLPCGTVYETSVDAREGLRWYDGAGRLVRRKVSQDLDGSWSLSPTGDGPTVTISAHDNWRNEYLIPGDEASGTTVAHGDGFTAQAPGFGVISHIAGLDPVEGDHRGIFRVPEDPAVAAELCAALGG